MRRIGLVSVFLVIPTVIALALGLLREDEPIRVTAPLDGGAEPPEPGARPHQDPGESVWVAIDFVDLEAGGSSEYFGRTDRASLETLLKGRLGGYFRLEGVFWMYEDGEVERLDEDLAYGDSAYFRVDSIRRVTPLKDGFPEATRRLAPGDRIVPSVGRDA
ncbi:hypothetical protein [Tautonia plasticadhaerens]|uniref:Uncharacterized protein n=1 Tax=Tautonia plasticadhaerens TaxID=2527974 RepID=A0A518GXB9_9BACT|nr:hypothetical protein [Tautonia plasticadhaerens]QDV33229.1 hypothetical protein ElP_10710 [Tautonia plasticadhaerens]